jgi:tetratricopeptide (TPR) repeat protein
VITTDHLAQALDDEDAAATLLEYVADYDLILEVDTLTKLPRGYTGARLLVVFLAHATGPRKPRRCIAKMCPQDGYRPTGEGQQHRAALHSSPVGFTQKHLTEVVLGPVPCASGAQIIVQEIAGGSIAGHWPLSKMSGTELTTVCDQIRLGLLRDWITDGYDRSRATVTRLLELELRDSFEPNGWLRSWAQDRALLEPGCEWIEMAPDGVLPNPFRLLSPGSRAASCELDYLTGRSHGDLHADNVLIPHADGLPSADNFWLIDLATFEPQGPLSRDVATLALSLNARHAGQLEPTDQDALIRYMISDAPTSTVTSAEAHHPLTEIIRALWSPDETFIGRGWVDLWRVQLRISCLAQALLHATYRSVGNEGRWWCFRLAAQLARTLLPDEPIEGSQPRQIDPRICAEVPATASSDLITLPSARARHGNPRFVDRREQRARLRSALKDDMSSIIVISGPAGVGKTQLVQEVLAELSWDTAEPADRRICRHDAAPGTRLNMKALIDDIEHGATPANQYVYGAASQARMTAALDGYTGVPLVIIVESAECLLNDTYSLRDPDLDEALEILSARSRNLVKVVLVSQEAPLGDAAVTWPDTVYAIPLSGLAIRDFRRFLEKLDQAAESGLAALAPELFLQVHSRLRGNPRLAELLHALVSWADWDRGAQDVPSWLASLNEEEVPQQLIYELIGGLPGGHQRVIEALAAFGTPVSEPAVSELLEYLPRTRVREALRLLVRRNIARMTHDQRYYMPRSDVDRILAHLPAGDLYEDADGDQTRWSLLYRAARVLDSLLKDDDDVHSISDLSLHFGRLDVLLRAGMFAEAHEAIMAMDQLLRQWNQEAMLRRPREAVRGKLDEPRARTENYVALGDMYSSLGLLTQAGDSYQAALSLARAHQSLEDLLRIYINMGQMYKEHNDIRKALEYFGSAKAIAQEQGEEADGDRVKALEGLADCVRAWGRFAEAIDLGRKALSIAERAGSPRTVEIALKLTRWLADVDLLKEAGSMLAVAQDSGGFGNLSVRAACLDCEADLVFRRGGAAARTGAGEYLDEAARRARQAVDMALAQRDPAILRQARTTLCAIHLQRDDVAGARTEIEAAARLRREGHSLLVVALRGLVAWRGGEWRKAAELFSLLRQEAQQRVDSDRRDFAAADMLGIARCAEALADGTSLAQAVEVFRTARTDTEPARGIARQLRFLVGQLVRDDPRPDRLRPVLDAITAK